MRAFQLAAAPVLVVGALASSLFYGRHPAALGDRRHLAITELMTVEMAYARVHEPHLADPTQLRAYFPDFHLPAHTQVALWGRKAVILCATASDAGHSRAVTYALGSDNYTLRATSDALRGRYCGARLGKFAG